MAYVSGEQQDDDLTGWIFMMQGTWSSTPKDEIHINYVGEEGDEFEQLLLDSGAFVNVCPAKSMQRTGPWRA